MESIANGYVKASLFQFQTIFLDISVKTRSQDEVDIQQNFSEISIIFLWSIGLL